MISHIFKLHKRKYSELRRNWRISFHLEMYQQPNNMEQMAQRVEEQRHIVQQLRQEASIKR